jgi:outer membrane protein OmpA-like peptidoglycan-associated protein
MTSMNRDKNPTGTLAMSSTTYKLLTTAVMGLSLIGGVANAQTAAQQTLVSSEGLTPLTERLSDRRIQADLKKLAQLQARIDKISAKAPDTKAFSKSLASAWLEAARAEYLDNNEDGWESKAYVQALALVNDLERGSAKISTLSGTGNKQFAAIQNKYKQWENDPYFSCVYEEAGKLNGLLAWAEHEEMQDPEHFKACLPTKFNQIDPLAAAIEQKLPGCRPPPPPPMKRIVLDAVHFELDKANLDDKSKHILDEIVVFLKQIPQLRIESRGHTDPRNTDQYNLKLSSRRANVVRDYIIAQGIDPSRVDAAWFGEAKLITPETDFVSMARNRRTEIAVVAAPNDDSLVIEEANKERDLKVEKEGDDPEVRWKNLRFKVKKAKVPGKKADLEDAPVQGALEAAKPVTLGKL